MGPNLEVLRLDARKFARIALISQALIDKLQIIEGYNHRTKRVVCCLRMTALRPVIVVRSSVQKPASSARRDSTRIDRPTPASSSPRGSRSGGIDGRLVPSGSCPRPCGSEQASGIILDGLGQEG